MNQHDEQQWLTSVNPLMSQFYDVDLDMHFPDTVSQPQHEFQWTCNDPWQTIPSSKPSCLPELEILSSEPNIDQLWDLLDANPAQPNPDSCQWDPSFFTTQPMIPYENSSTRGNSIDLSSGSSWSSPPTSFSSPATLPLPPEDPKPSPSQDPSWIPSDIQYMGHLDAQGSWKCSYASCTSPLTFERACDLRKHFRSHNKTYFCGREDCPRARAGFSSRKDLERHRGTHKPDIKCTWENCGRVFSRTDNMEQHVKRVHQRPQNTLFPRPCRRRNTSKSS